MIDALTNERVVVTPLCSAGCCRCRPEIYLSTEQVAIVTAILTNNGIVYEVDDHAISLNGGPYITNIVLDRTADVSFIQKLLDEPVSVDIDGKQISAGRCGIVERGVALLKSKNPEMDLNLCKIVMTIVPKE